MKYQDNVLSASPVLGRFTDIRELWLGLDIGKKVKKTRKTRKTSFKNKLTRIQKSLAKKTIKGTLNLAITLSLLVSAVWFGPRLMFALFPSQTEQVQAEEVAGNFTLEIDEAKLDVRSDPSPSKRNYQPPYNENLPEGEWLIIPRIGVRSTLQPTENYEDALVTGVWMAPDFGRPGDRDLPVILAGHRFGFKWWWESDYWKYNSFYLLPELEEGDTVEIISNKRKYVYEIYEGEEGSEITDYEADLIVYTCKYLDSPERIFRYARLDMIQQQTPLGIL